MSERGDEVVEKGTARRDDLADKAATSGGVRAMVSNELAEDAAFLRKLKPSLVAARIRGELPKDAAPGSGARRPVAPDLGPHSSGGTSRGPSPLAVVAAAAAAGILIAKIVDWRGHAHPRR